MCKYATEYYPSSLEGDHAVIAPVVIETVLVALIDESFFAQPGLLLALQVLEAGLGEQFEPSLYGIVLGGYETGDSESFDAVG